MRHSLPDRSRRYVFTSATLGYLPKVRVLAQTLKATNPDVWFVLVLVDESERDLCEIEPCIDEVLPASALAVPDWSAWLFKHELVEACTGFKGPALEYLLDRPDCDSVLYLDPDIAVFSDLAPVYEALQNSPIVLTPHLLEPELSEQGIVDHELGSLRHGVFNLGFLGVRAMDEGIRFAAWWRERLMKWCFDDIPSGLFTDQRWVDLVPGFFPNAGILRHPGCNVATWNISRRHLSLSEDGQYLVNGLPLVFFHFSGLDSGAQTVMLERYADSASKAFHLRRWYDDALAITESDLDPPPPWMYDFFADGRVISTEHRRTYRERGDLQKAFPNPFAVGEGSFLAWCDQQRFSGDSRQKPPTILHISHYGGGGTEVFLSSLFSLTAACCRNLLLKPRWGRKLVMTDPQGEEFVTPDTSDGLTRMLSEIRRHGVERIVLHHVLGLELSIANILDQLAVPYDVVLHDYYFATPNPYLTSGGKVSDDGVVDLLPFHGAQINPGDSGNWLAWTLPLLFDAERVIAPSTDTARRYRKLIPSLMVMDQWHPELPRPEKVSVGAGQATTGPIRIVAINACDPIKGSNVLQEVLALAEASGVSIEVHVLGAVPVGYPSRSNLVLHGGFDHSSVRPTIAKIRPELGWVPSQFPETYCYALSDLMSLGLPILASDLGALPERLYGRERSGVVPYDSTAEVWLHSIIQLTRGRADSTIAPLAKYEGGGDDFYVNGFLEPAKA